MTHDPLHLRVGLIARHQQHCPGLFGLGGDALDLLHKGTGGVMVADTAGRQLVINAAGHAVAADDYLVPGRHILHGVHHLCALALHILHRLRVVDQRAQRSDPVPLCQKSIGQLHGAVDAKAEPRRFGNSDLHLLCPHLFPRIQQSLFVGTQLFGIPPTFHGKLGGRHGLDPEFADVRSLEGVAPTKKPAVPTIAVPTTAGTAAEVTINYVITDVEKKRKFVCVDVHDIPVVAVVDPEMMASMPKGLTAATGMDALTHAIEGYITKGAWEMTDMFHLKAIEIISRSLRGAVANTKEGREDMALGQYVAGMGFSNVGLGIVHSMAHALGAVYDTPHGVANAILLPTVMEYNADATGEKYRDIAKAMGVKGTENMTQEEYRKAAVDAVRQLSKDVGIPQDLKQIVKDKDVDFLAQSAMDDACRPGNPKDPTLEDIKALYRSLM